MNHTSLSIKQNMLWNSAGSLLYLVCQWLITVFVVRLSSGFDAAGALSLAMAVGNVFSPIAQYKMRSYQVSDVKKKISAGEYVGFRILTIVTALILSIAYAAMTIPSEMIVTVLLYVLFKAIDSFIDVLHGVDQQNMRLDYCGKSLAMRGVLSLLGFCIALKLSNSLELAVCAMCLSTAPVVIYDYRRSSQFDDLRPHFSLELAKRLTVQCFPAVIGFACCSAVATVARQQLNAISGTEMLGIYASVCTPVVVVQAGAGYIYSPLLGYFASAFERGDFKKYRNMLIKVSLCLAGLTAASFLGFTLFGKPLLSVVFGTKIARYSWLMYAAIVSVVLCAYSAFLSDQLIVVRKMWNILLANGISLVITPILSNKLISNQGMNGTSIATIVAYALSSAIMLVLLLRTTVGHRKIEQSDNTGE